MRTLQSILLCSILAGQFLFSQKSETPSFGNSTSYISFSPLSIGDIYAPRMRVGYVQNLNGRWKIGADLGYGSNAMALSRNLGDTYRLWEIRPEIYRIFNPQARTLKYLSAEFFYIRQNNEFVDENYDREDGQGIEYSTADYQRTKYGMHLKFGLFLNIGEHFGFNFYGGVGLRYRNNEYSNVIGATEARVFREWYPRPQDNEGKNYNINPSLGFKFYYKI